MKGLPMLSHITRAPISAALLASLALPAFAGEVLASDLRYKNNGAYTAQFYIRYNLDDGTKCKVKPKGDVASVVAPASWVQYDLHDAMTVKAGGSRCLSQQSEIPYGSEVWGFVDISEGEGKSCRKDKKVFFNSSGGTVKYMSKGTTLNNNRCRVTNWP
ncbi:MAG: hypothetical protein AAF767_08580 [Pseudomonadota bacterium]